VTPQQLTHLIQEDLKQAGTAFVWHGRPLDECLQKPEKRRFLNSHADNAPEDLWLVFEEGPTPGHGYMVVYDESLNEFGLAVQGTPDPVVIGIYGSFLETLNSM
jgi:hypothetical protein